MMDAQLFSLLTQMLAELRGIREETAELKARIDAIETQLKLKRG